MVRRLCVVLGGFVIAVFAAGGIGWAMLPNHSLTPGATDPRIMQATIATTICTVGYSQTGWTVPRRIRRMIYDEYNIPQGERGGTYLIDYLIPPEVGGSKDPANLWPEPAADVVAKDHVDATIHDLVCNGALDLATAQAALARSWTTALATTSMTTAPR